MHVMGKQFQGPCIFRREGGSDCNKYMHVLVTLYKGYF